MTAHQLGKLSLIDLQGRYLQLFPADNHRHQFIAQVRALADMSRENLIEHILAGQP